MAHKNFAQGEKHTIYVPGLHKKEDPLARDGGALHCVTWNVLADVPEWAKEEA